MSCRVDEKADSTNKPLRVVFIGNIPYESTEEELTKLFSTVGPVKAFRLVFDKVNGKPKGYGFCEYADPHLAKSCIKHLNNVELNGRSLRVDFADSELGAPKEGRKDNQIQKNRKDGYEFDNKSNIMTPPLVHPYAPHPVDDYYMQQPHYPMPMPPPHYRMPMHGYPQAPQGVPSYDYSQPPQPFRQRGVGRMDYGSLEYPGVQQVPPVNVNPQQYEYGQQNIQRQTDKASLLKNLPPSLIKMALSKIKSLIQTNPEQARSLLNNNPQFTYLLFDILCKLDLIVPAIVKRITTKYVGKLQSQSGSGPQFQQNANPGDPRLQGQRAQNNNNMQKELMNKVMQMTPTEIDLLPPEQRNEVLSIRSMLKQQ